MSNPAGTSSASLLPQPAAPGEELVTTSISLDRDNLDWLDSVATDAKRSRSEALRIILWKVRGLETRR